MRRLKKICLSLGAKSVHVLLPLKSTESFKDEPAVLLLSSLWLCCCVFRNRTRHFLAHFLLTQLVVTPG